MFRWAIRVIGTDKYFPEHPKNNRGFSHDEPISIEERAPRLFRSWDGARKALRAWYKGRWVVTRSRPDLEGEITIDIAVKEVKARAHIHLEIVKFALTEVLADTPKVAPLGKLGPSGIDNPRVMADE